MAAMTKIRLKNQLTIPQEAMKAANLHVGDMVEAIVEEGRIILKPRILVDRDALAQELKKIYQQAPVDRSVAAKSEEEIMEEAIRLVKESRA
ncbi:MAG: AbrB/MazE/SpoVT family DNA-binding domain-containing protein [Chromatiaceae bacterium]|nr:AbrB/MazE/SpoVT family DNA-binding domain-containing protein [Chromatiaceae bacterium]